MIEKDPYFELEHEDLMSISKMQCEDLIDVIIEKKSIQVRRRARVNYARNIIERLTDIKASKSSVRYIDFISAKIDEELPTDVILETAEKITDPAEKEAVLCLFIVRKAYKLFKYYYRFLSRRGIEFNIHYINMAIEYDAFDILAVLKKTYPEEFERNQMHFIPSLIKTFDNSCGFLQQKIEILRTLIKFMTFFQAQSLLQTVKNKIEEEEPESNLLLYSPNLILDCCLLHELSYLCEQKFPLLSALSEPIRERTREVGANFVEGIESPAQLKALVFERDVSNRDSLTLISMYNMHEMLAIKNIEKTALELWNSEYDVSGSIMECSSALKMLRNHEVTSLVDFERFFRFYNSEASRRVDHQQHHLFQFKVWRHSMMVKFIVQGVALFLVNIIMQYFLNEAISSAHEALLHARLNGVNVENE